MDDDTHADYSEYGKVKDDDVCETKIPFDDARLRGRLGGQPRRTDNWEDNIYEHQSFDSKAELLSQLRLMAVMLRFTFRVDKSTTKLFVAKCKVAGCDLMVRAAVKNEATTFWVIKYMKSHTCSVSDRVGKRRRCTSNYHYKNMGFS
uniref:Transposase MuDR plant domain-containing protein n=1 Tax=Noccaea caerulescens TaxID=107243 RepID=A0A1J3F6U2_NOCCA